MTIDERRRLRGAIKDDKSLALFPGLKWNSLKLAGSKATLYILIWRLRRFCLYQLFDA